MKIACLAGSQIPSRRANSIQVMKVCHALAAGGHDLCLWVPGKEQTEWDEMALHFGLSVPFSVRWIPNFNPIKKYDFYLRSFLEMRKWGAELVYTWIVPSAVLGLAARIPTVLELHAPLSGLVAPHLFKRMMASPTPKRVMFITRALEEMVAVQLGRPFKPAETLIAPNGVELDQYDNLPCAEIARQNLSLAPGLTAGYTGHFYQGRGIDVLFHLARTFPNVNFLWVGGNPPDFADWQKRFVEAQVSNITMTGFVNHRHLPMYQAACDILLMPYSSAVAGSSGGNQAAYNSPMKMFDYLASGRALISSDLPVLHEVLNQANAVFCPPDDALAWEKALARLLGDEALRARLGQQALADSQKYTWRVRAEAAVKGMV